MKKIYITISKLLILTLIFTSSISAFAHSSVLLVEQEDCQCDVLNIGDDETWYCLTKIDYKDNDDSIDDVAYQNHMDESITEIRYYFSPSAENDATYTWTTDIYNEYRKGMSDDEAAFEAELTAQEIKRAYGDSMEKWNNVYYYTYDENGNRLSNKIITVYEVFDEVSSNLIIYPRDYHSFNHNDSIVLASASTSGIEIPIPNSLNNIAHSHFSQWVMYVNVCAFFEHEEISCYTLF